MDYTRREFGKITLATATLPLASWKLVGRTRSCRNVPAEVWTLAMFPQ